MTADTNKSHQYFITTGNKNSAASWFSNYC